MFKVFTIDPTPIKGQLIAMLESCMEAARKQVKAAVEEIPQAPSVIVATKDIVGLRDQILTNATLLLPILQPEAVSTYSASNRRIPVSPKLYVVTSGSAPSITASVVHGHDLSRTNTMFLFADKGATASEALENLLSVTSRLVQMHVFDNYVRESFAVKIVGGGGYMSNSPKASPTAQEDMIFWGSSADPSPNLPANVSFKSSGSSNGSDGICLKANTTSANESIKQNGSFHGNGSIRGNGASVSGSLNKENSFHGGSSLGTIGLGVNGSLVPSNNYYGCDKNGSIVLETSQNSNDGGVNGSFKTNRSFQGDGSFYGNRVSPGVGFMAAA